MATTPRTTLRVEATVVGGFTSPITIDVTAAELATMLDSRGLGAWNVLSIDGMAVEREPVAMGGLVRFAA